MTKKRTKSRSTPTVKQIRSSEQTAASCSSNALRTQAEQLQTQCNSIPFGLRNSIGIQTTPKNAKRNHLLEALPVLVAKPEKVVRRRCADHPPIVHHTRPRWIGPACDIGRVRSHACRFQFRPTSSIPTVARLFSSRVNRLVKTT